MSTLLKALIVAGIAVGGAAHASTVMFETAISTAGPQAGAGANKAAGDAAFALPGSHSAVVPLLDNLSNQGVFGGSATYIAFRSTIAFGVNAGQAGSWGLRAGVDFGNGGAVFLDGVALGYKTNDMWWAGSYGDASQSFQFTALPIAAGNHTLQLFGLEHCCDGGQQAQFSLDGTSYTTFGAHDGLAAAVPEPETSALMLAGLGAVGVVARRRAKA